jgi:hypothetical protein
MLEGIIICVLLVLALIGLHLWNKPKVVVGNLPPVTTKIPMPEVKPPRQPAASTLYSAPYGSMPVKTPEQIQREADARRRIRIEEEEREARRRERERRQREEDAYADSIYDSTPDLLTTAVTAAAAVIIADTVYDTFVAPSVDTSSSSSYSSPTPSSYSDSSSSYSDSSSSYSDSSSSSSSDSGSSW